MPVPKFIAIGTHILSFTFFDSFLEAIGLAMTLTYFSFSSYETLSSLSAMDSFFLSLPITKNGYSQNFVTLVSRGTCVLCKTVCCVFGVQLQPPGCVRPCGPCLHCCRRRTAAQAIMITPMKNGRKINKRNTPALPKRLNKTSHCLKIYGGYDNKNASHLFFVEVEVSFFTLYTSS